MIPEWSSIGDVKGLALPKGTQTSLLAKLDDAQAALKVGNTAAACSDLGSFISETSAQSGKKIAASDAVIAVTNKAMQVAGGQGYSRSLSLERHLRDGRASSVMAPTTEVLKEWLGKIQCGLPLF